MRTASGCIVKCECIVTARAAAMTTWVVVNNIILGEHPHLLLPVITDYNNLAARPG